MKIIIVLLDGLGDRSYPELDHRTPLQAARTPNLDRLARMGSNGLYHASRPGQCLPSETAHFLLLGYPLDRFPGRGLFEAVGAAVPFEADDVLCMAHLSGVTWQGGVPVLTRGRRDIQGSACELNPLFEDVAFYETDRIRFSLHQTQRNDAILVLKGQVSPYISDADPMQAGLPIALVQPLSGNPEPERSTRTAQALNRYLSYCHRRLSGHDINRSRADKGLWPADFLATLRCGRRIVQPRFAEQWGLQGLLVASGGMYAGLAAELGLTFKSMKDGSDVGKDLRDRIASAMADPDHDFIHVHTKAPDEAGHTGSPELKMQVITELDRGLDELATAVEKRDDLLVAITADHSTPSRSALIHSGEPVPAVLVGPTVRRDDVSAFDEVSAAAGGLGQLQGVELMWMLLNYADRSTLAGQRLGETERSYVPDNYPPFALTDPSEL